MADPSQLTEDLERTKTFAAASQSGAPSAESAPTHTGSPETLAPTPKTSGQDEHLLAAAEVAGVPSSAGRFRNLQFHAQGGMGAVFVADDGELNRRIALKTMRGHRAHDSAGRRRFIREAEITGALEHPGVVPVYSLSQDNEGNPYYAMRFIQGQSLATAAKKFHEQPLRDFHSLAFRQLLKRFQDTCNTLAFAHSKGVIHRDIKPANIMLGDFGETLVVDWGLARMGDEPHDPSASAGGQLADDADPNGKTSEGTVIGTPAFMSPEQAEGRVSAVGITSDVYSLGATLFVLLTNRSPFQGTAGQVLASIPRGDFPRPCDVNPDVPKPLEAICLKAMALQPANRYASASKMADDVDQYLAGEPVGAHRESLLVRAGRWMRNHPRLVTGTAVAVLAGIVGLAGVAAVQTRAKSELAGKNLELQDTNAALDKQRNRAEAREDEAIDAVKRFRDAVANDPLLKNTPQLEDLRKRLLGEPLTFFRHLRDQLQADGDTRPEALARLAVATDDLAILTREIGDKENALAAARESLAIFRKLADEHPNVATYQYNRALVHHRLAQLLEQTGGTGARTEFESAIEIFRKLGAKHPADTECQSRLAGSHSHLGNFLRETGELSAARAEYESALAIHEKLAAEHPTVTDYQINLATGHTNLGNLYSDTGQPALARAAYELALAIEMKLAAEHSSVPDHQSRLAHGHNNLGMLLSAAGEPAAARTEYETSLAIRQKLINEHPTITEYQGNLAESHSNLGNLLRQTGELTGARIELERALAIEMKLTAEHPTVPDYRGDLANTHNDVGILQREMGELTAARTSCESALAIIEELAAEHLAVVRYQSILAASHNNLGILLQATGDSAAARTEYALALAIRRKLAAEHPESPDYASDLGGTLNNLSIIERNTSQLADARQRLREAINWQEKALASNPNHPTYRQYMTNHLNLLIQVADALGNADEAAQARRELAEFTANDPRFAALEARLEAVLAGAAPKDNAERLALAQRAFDTGRYAAAARLFAESLNAKSSGRRSD